ncbi:MAG: cytochrome-c peroxidase [Sandaracinus sp.]
MRTPATLAVVLALLGGCRPPDTLAPPPSPYPGYPGTPPETTGMYIDARAASVVSAAETPPPISGGTLGVTADGRTIVAADPDRDRVMLVDVATQHTTTLTLPAGAEPGRVAIDDAHALAHVVLRGSGEALTVHLEGAPLPTRRTVCAAPRGIAVDAERNVVRVACRDGQLVSFDGTTSAPVSSIQTGLDDLRDVIVRGNELVVSRFRAAELVRLDAETGTELGVSHVTPTSSVSPTQVDSNGNPAEFRPAVMWRAIPMGDAILVSHQRSSDGELNLAPGAYYSTGVCSGSIVQSAATIFDGQSLTPIDTPNIAGATLPVDIARSAQGEIAIVGAGIESTDFAPSVTRIQTASLQVGGGSYGGCLYGDSYYGYYGTGEVPTDVEHTPNAIAAIYLPDGRLVVQGREPAQIRIEVPGDGDDTVVALGGRSVFDTGHAFFHGDAGRGTACASCHPEGGDDGRVWHFAGIGDRRTPRVPQGFLETAPFHWDGDLPDISHLMGTVFTQRMGGPAVDASHASAIGHWLDTRPADLPRTSESSTAVERGAHVFAEAGCASCHSGAMLTNNQTVDVGTGRALQVPSLIGVARALPVMHDGCAHTLAQRFDPACGGAAHGTILSTDDPRIPDLVAYLETL